MRFRLPSLDAIADGTRRAVTRFPVTTLVALLATVAGIRLVNAGGPDEMEKVRLFATALLGFPLSVALTVGLERRNIRGGANALIVLVLTAVGIGIWWLGFPRWTDTIRATRGVQLALLYHLLVACLPFIGRNEPNAFWQYNRTLLERWLTGAVYAAVLFFGLALALAAVDNLFGLDVPERTYARLWMVMTFTFHPLFTLAGIPDRIEDLERDESYPAGLRTFAYFVLVPLTALYLLIITAYFVKVVATSTWPSGWIGWLVSGAAIVGILTLLLASPPAARARAPWVESFERWFWPALLPASIMLALAIGKRIGQYGITERRYFLAVLTGWLFVVALAFTFRRARGLIVIPASLAALAAITFAGPWGAYQVSKRSQVGRLESLLTRLEMYDGKRITPAPEQVNPELGGEAANVLRYLADTHGRRGLEPWLEARGMQVPPPAEDSLATASGHQNRDWAYQNAVVSAMGLEGLGPTGERQFWIARQDAVATQVRGWDWLVPMRSHAVNDHNWPTGDTLVARFAEGGSEVEVRRGGVPVARADVGASLAALGQWRRTNPAGNPPDSLLSFPATTAEGVDLLVRIRSGSLKDSAGTWQATSMEGDVLLREPEGSGE